jgi:hypothetical protein
MTGRDMFAVIIRGFGAYFIYRAIDGGVALIVVACGFDFHLKNAAATDSFFYLSYFLIGALLIFWADRLAGLVYRGERAASPDKD